MYKTIFDWSNTDYSGFTEFLKRLYANSVDFYNYYSKDEELTKIKNKPKIRDFVQNIEKYMYWLIKMDYVTRDNINKVLYKLMSIQLIRIIDKAETLEKGNVVGFTKDNIISLTPQIESSKNLTSEERSLLYSTHEYGHIINSAWSDYAPNLANIMWKDVTLQREANRYGFSSPYYFYNGLKLLDEVITQDTAENVTYNESSKTRPAKSFKKSNTLYNNGLYFTNFDFYGEFQELGVKFAKVCKFLNIDINASFEETLEVLSKKSMNDNFLCNLYNEIASNKKDFYIMLCALGLIKDAYYQSANINLFSDSNERSSESLNIFNNLSNYNLEKKKKYLK